MRILTKPHLLQKGGSSVEINLMREGVLLAKVFDILKQLLVSLKPVLFGLVCAIFLCVFKTSLKCKKKCGRLPKKRVYSSKEELQVIIHFHVKETATSSIISNFDTSR